MTSIHRPTKHVRFLFSPELEAFLLELLMIFVLFALVSFAAALHLKHLAWQIWHSEERQKLELQVLRQITVKNLQTFRKNPTKELFGWSKGPFFESRSGFQTWAELVAMTSDFHLEIGFVKNEKEERIVFFQMVSSAF